MIVCDLDGVFADFGTAACVVHGHPNYQVKKWGFFEDWGIGLDEFWAKIHALGDEFYRDVVQPLPWAEQLLELISEIDEFVIMSSPSDSPFGYSGKKIWVDKYLGEKIPLIVGSQKQFLARGNSRILLDDYEGNIRAFRRAGGCTLTFPQMWNSKRIHISDRMHYVEQQLKSWAENAQIRPYT